MGSANTGHLVQRYILKKSVQAMNSKSVKKLLSWLLPHFLSQHSALSSHSNFFEYGVQDVRLNKLFPSDIDFLSWYCIMMIETLIWSSLGFYTSSACSNKLCEFPCAHSLLCLKGTAFSYSSIIFFIYMHSLPSSTMTLEPC